jgi:hypothetical protein
MVTRHWAPRNDIRGRAECEGANASRVNWGDHTLWGDLGFDDLASGVMGRRLGEYLCVQWARLLAPWVVVEDG